jgi:hypothetical protein
MSKPLISKLKASEVSLQCPFLTAEHSILIQNFKKKKTSVTPLNPLNCAASISAALRL